MRITTSEVHGAFGSLVATATAAGIDTAGWVLVHGSPTNGRAWRLYKQSASGSYSSIGCDDYLGTTGREAYLTLRGMASGLSLIAYPVPAK